MPASRFAINTYSYIWRHAALECLDHLADAGFTHFELLVNPPHLWPAALDRAQRAAVAALLARRGLQLVSLNPPSLDLNLASPAAEMRRYTLDHYRAVIELAGEWGATHVIVVPGKTHPLLPAPAAQVHGWFHAALDELLVHAETANVDLLLENLPMAFLPRAQDLVDAVAAIGAARLGIVYDVANGFFIGEDPAQGILTSQPHLRLVHLSDTGTQRWEHAPVGSGAVPFGTVANALAKIAYRGPCVLEIISHAPEKDIPDSEKRLQRLGWRGGQAVGMPSGT